MKFLILASLAYSVLTASDSQIISTQLVSNSVKSSENPRLTKSMNLEANNKNENSNGIKNLVEATKIWSSSSEEEKKEKKNFEKENKFEKNNKNKQNDQDESTLPIIKNNPVGSKNEKENKTYHTSSVSNRNFFNQKEESEREPRVHQIKESELSNKNVASPKISEVEKKDFSQNKFSYITPSPNTAKAIPSNFSSEKQTNKPEEKTKESQADKNMGKQLRVEPLPEKIVVKDSINSSTKKEPQSAIQTSSSTKTTKKVEETKNLPQLPKILPAEKKEESKIKEQVKPEENTKPKGIQSEPHKIENQSIQNQTQPKFSESAQNVPSKAIIPNIQKTPSLSATLTLTPSPQNPSISLDPFSQSKIITIDSENNLSTSDTNIYKGKENYLDGVSNNVFGNSKLVNNGNYNTIQGNSNTIHNGDNNQIISNSNFVRGSGNVVN